MDTHIPCILCGKDTMPGQAFCIRCEFSEEDSPDTQKLARLVQELLESKISKLEAEFRYIKRRIHGLDLPDFSDESIRKAKEKAFKEHSRRNGLSMSSRMYKNFVRGDSNG